MPVVEKGEKDEHDTAAPEQAEEEAHAKKESEKAPEEADAADAAPQGEQQEEAADKKQVQPRIHIRNPPSGSAFPVKSKLPIEVECEGEGEFQAQLQLRNQHGWRVWDNEITVKLGAENKGHLDLLLDLDEMMSEGGADRSGSYQLHAFGTDASGRPAPMSRINIDLIDEERQHTPNMPRDVENAPPDDGGRGGTPGAGNVW